MLKRLVLTFAGIGLFIGTSFGTTVSGTITDSFSTTPVNKVIVQLRSGNRVLGTDTTDVQGAYSITVTDSTGKCSVRAILIGTYFTKSVDTALSSAPLTINIALSKIIISTISGVVKDSVAGTALTGAVVSLGFGVNARRDTTGADGVFSFDSVRSGTQTLSVSMVNYTIKKVQLTVGSAAVTADVALVGIAYGSVSGVVSDTSTGLPINGAIVRIGIGSNAQVDTTGPDGVYSLSDIRIGNQTISVTCSKYVSKSIQIAVAGTAPVKQNFALVALLVTSVSGIVTDRGKSTPLAGVIVRIYNNRTNKYDTTGADGKYQFAEVSNGSVVMIVRATGFAALRDTFTVSGTNPVTHNVALNGKTAINLQQLSKGSTTPLIVLSGDKFAVTNISGAGKLTIFSLNGKCVYKAVFEKNRASIALPSNILSSGLSLVAQITVEGKSWTQQIFSTK